MSAIFLAFGIPSRRSDFLAQLNIPLPPVHSTVSFGGSMVSDFVCMWVSRSALFWEISVACSTISTWPTVGYKNLNHEFFPLKKNSSNICCFIFVYECLYCTCECSGRKKYMSSTHVPSFRQNGAILVDLEVHMQHGWNGPRGPLRPTWTPCPEEALELLK